MATWKKLLHESSPASDFPTLNQATTGNAGTVTNGLYTTDLLDEDNMASDSATKVASQQSIKAYVDAQAGTDIVTYENLSGNSDIGFGAAQVPQGSATAPLASPTFTGTVTTPDITLTDIANAGSDVDKFLVLDGSNNVDFRTGAEVLSDIGGQASGSYAPAGGASGTNWACNDLTVSGSMTITGDIDQYNVTVLDVADKSIKLNAGQTGTPSLDAEIVAERGDSTDAKVYWDESEDQWRIHNGTVVAEIVTAKHSTATTAPTGDQTGVGSLYVADTDGTPVAYIRVT